MAVVTQGMTSTCEQSSFGSYSTNRSRKEKNWRVKSSWKITVHPVPHTNQWSDPTLKSILYQCLPLGTFATQSFLEIPVFAILTILCEQVCSLCPAGSWTIKRKRCSWVEQSPLPKREPKRGHLLSSMIVVVLPKLLLPLYNIPLLSIPRQKHHSVIGRSCWAMQA